MRLLKPAELPADWDPTTDSRLTVWEMVHQLIRVLEAGGEGAAAALVAKLGSQAETARELCYRLYTLCERKKRANEAMAYNGLVQSWPEITRLARETPRAGQARHRRPLRSGISTMAITNHERVGKALELLKAGLGPFVEREFKAQLRPTRWAMPKVQRFLSDDPMLANKGIGEWDVAALLKLMWETWNEVFRKTLGYAERSLVSEIRDWRNKWAHQEPFSSDDAYRALDSAGRLLTAVSAPQADEVEKMKMELLRVRFDEQARSEKRKSSSIAIESGVTGSLKPWREVVMPHEDVASGRYQQAEFAADLWQVHLGEGTDEYRNPVEFFRRTYLTESLKEMLVGAVRRLTGGGGDPVVQLQTNFGGGKTHSMLALYHLFSGIAPTELAGIDAVMQEAGATTVPTARRVVLVGNKISPGNPSVKADGTVVRTLWGELAWQLGGKKALCPRGRPTTRRRPAPATCCANCSTTTAPA